MIHDEKGVLVCETFAELVAELRRREVFLYRQPNGKLLVVPSDRIADLGKYIARYKTKLLWLAVPFRPGAHGGMIQRMTHPLIPEGFYVAADDAPLDGSGFYHDLPVLTYTEWMHLRHDTPEGIALVIYMKAFWGGSVVQSVPLPSDLLAERKYAPL